LGLATGLNPTIVQTLPALSLAAIFLWRRIRLRYLGAALLVILLLVAGVYSYLPLRAREYPFTNWGNPQTWELFWGHVRGEGLDIYDPQTNSINGFTGSPRVWAQSTGRYLFLVLVQFTPVLVPLILLGMYYLFVKNWRLFSVLIAIPSTNLIFGALYLSGNQESWFIASYVIFAIFLGAGMAFCAKIFLAKNLSYRVLSAVILCVSLLPLFWWFPKLNRSHQIVTKEYAENLYRNIPDDGKSVLIGSGDFFNSLSHYMYSVEGKKGIFPVTVNMWYILPWYRDTLRHYRPDLMPQELEGMIKMKEVSEYNRVLNWWIEYLLHKGMRVYITPSVFRETVLAGTNEGRYKVDKTRLRVIPDGLTFRALEAHDILQPGEFDFQFSDPKFYEKPPFYLERNYKAGYNLLLSEYAYAYMALGDEFDSREKTEENVKKAQRYFEKAYLFAPFAEDVVNRLAIFWANHGDLDIAVRYFTEAASLDPSNIDIRLNRAYALLEVGDLAEAEKELQFVMNNAQNQEQAKNALSGFAELNKKKIISQIPNDWKVFEGKKSGILFAYPPDWKVTENGKLVVVKDALGNFEISFFAGDEVVSPIKVSGQIVQEGPAQIPGFEAQARIRQEKEDKQSIEFFLRQGQKNLHILVEPFDARFMPMFDKIISTLRFVAG
jgi:tetratricopeptide (TPR) repeat protein